MKILTIIIYAISINMYVALFIFLTRAELLEEIKILFMDNLKESQNRFSNDPLTTDTCVHVTGSEPQSASKSWKKERYPL